ncbi:MAG TPA: hypothetical protein VM535_01660 [Candidatus Saccharimonadales bacterium]|nr:hypothetical protein [Candidatus Saccharimonadales bacterium]
MEFIDPRAKQLELELETVSEIQLCQRAVMAATTRHEYITMKLHSARDPYPLEPEATRLVLSGLADIELGKYGESGFCGLRPDMARRVLDRLSGDAEYFFYPILAEAG